MDECYEWPAGRYANGYGRIGRAGLAHRFIYRLIHGPIPEGMEIRHTCDNPPCVNPTHLWLGTHAENMQDMADRDRWRNQFRVPDKCKHGHDLTVFGAVHVREETGRWRCRECNKNYSAKSRTTTQGRQPPPLKA